MSDAAADLELDDIPCHQAELVGRPSATPAAVPVVMIADLRHGQAIVKLDEQGCVAFIDGAAFAAPAEAITILDTVVAGDAFVAGYLVGLLDGLAPTARLKQGARCGAFACLGPGDWESLPRRADLDALESTDPVTR